MLKILILCTGNSCRSILAEALVNHLAVDRFKAFSAGSHPTGEVNPNALATLKRHGIPAEGFSSQSWDEFEGKGIDIAITVCDQAAGEVCPVYLNSAVRAHWGLPDPAHIEDVEEKRAAFKKVYEQLARRIQLFMNLPIEKLDKLTLKEKLAEIGKLED